MKKIIGQLTFTVLHYVLLYFVQVSVVIFGTVIFWHITWTRPHYYINITTAHTYLLICINTEKVSVS